MTRCLLVSRLNKNKVRSELRFNGTVNNTNSVIENDFVKLWNHLLRTEGAEGAACS